MRAPPPVTASDTLDPLPLLAPTAPAWTAAAVARRDLIVLDHAHCEKKAAASALGLIFRHPERPRLVAAMSRIAREELLHFERMLSVLAERGVPFVRLEPSPYAAALARAARSLPARRSYGKAVRDTVVLLDELLVAALIEARSRERFVLLAAALPEPPLAALYVELGPAEARHAEVYTRLAFEVAPRDVVVDRLRRLAAAEAEIIAANAPLRLHAGPAT